jgi:Putative zinc-finger
VSFEPNNTALDFETMLRRHLRSGGAPVSACAGFDADTASAYLEGALGSKSRSLFEAHLAGCPACRHHVIDLGRLSHLALEAEPQVLPVTPRSGSLWQWKTAMGRKFDRWLDSSTSSAWSLDWRLAGTAIAVGAVLMAVIAVKPWHRTNQTDRAGSLDPRVITQHQVAPASLQASSSQTSPEPSIERESTDRMSALGQIRSEVPPPKLPATAGSNISTASQRDGINLNEILIGERSNRELVESPATNTEALPPPPRALNLVESKPAQSTAEVADSSRADRQVPVSLEARGVQYKAPVVEPEFTASPKDHPMRTNPLAEKRQDKTKGDKASQQNGRADWLSRAMGFVPFRKTDGDHESPAQVEEQEGPKPLIQHIRGKTFWHQRNIWVDREYNPEKMYWRVKRLAMGSQEFERVLAEEPQLQEFFKLAPVIVVWRDKVYRITNK